jgi:hypothetical protein
MATWKMVLRKAEPVGTLAVEADHCEAATKAEAEKIFIERHGHGRVVAGPLLVEEAPN